MTTPFRSGIKYTTLRKSLRLENDDDKAFFDPTSSLVFLRSESKDDLTHERIHVNQLSSTTAGIVMTALMALRTAFTEYWIKSLNAKMDSGLWVPLAAWMDDVYSVSDAYGYLTSLKRDIGWIDSKLYSIGAFESNNITDIEYWNIRFDWRSLFEDESWNFSFRRNPWKDGWWPFGITSLFEASAIYLEFLNDTGSILAANRAIQESIDQFMAIQKEHLRKDPQFMAYFGPFLIFDEYGFDKKPYPYHTVPITAFWAMQAPLPHPEPYIIAPSGVFESRANDRKFSWSEVDPGNLFYVLFGEVVDDLRGHSLSSSLRELAGSLSYGFWSATDKKLVMPPEIIEEDTIFIRSVRKHGENISVCLHTAFSRHFPTSLEDRLDAFFEFPVQSSQNVPIVTPTNGAPIANAEAYLLADIAEHLIPLWSYGGIRRFYLGKNYLCPSAPGGFLSSMCPAPKNCNGCFPETSGLPKDCWFQDTLYNKLSIVPSRINIVPGSHCLEEETLRR